MYKGLKTPKNVLDSNLFRGVTDFSNLTQFNLYEAGYQVFLVIKTPAFMDKLAQLNDEYAYIVNNYNWILEHEFKGLDGLEDLSIDTLQLSDGINELNMISKVNEPTATTINMTYTEKSGLTITKYHEMYLKGVKDPKAKQCKHYHGLIQQGLMEADWQNEVGIFLYMITDNTYMKVERAYLLLAAYPTSAPTGDIGNGTLGEIDKKDITISYNVFPVCNQAVYQKAAEALVWLISEDNSDRMVINSDEYEWDALKYVKTGAGA